MQLLSTFEGTRRSRRRRSFWRGLAWLGVLTAILGAAGVGYRIGVSQGRTEAGRLERDVGMLHERNRLLTERMARAEQQAEAVITREAQLQRRLEEELPRGELRQLLDLATERLRSGVPVERLAFLLREATLVRRCSREVETRRLVVHTPVATSPVGAVAFAEGRVMVSAEGASAPTTEAVTDAEPGFDPERPVTLRFLDIEGDVGSVTGRLPLTHALAQGQEEFLFAIRVSDRPGQIEVTSQRCNLP